MRRTFFVTVGLPAFFAAVAPATEAHAACNSTVNGIPMPPNICETARRVYGSVQPGHYWMNNDGTWGVVGDPSPRGNLSRDSQRGGGSGGGGWIHPSPGGTIGGDGKCAYFNDSSGNSVMSCD